MDRWQGNWGGTEVKIKTIAWNSNHIRREMRMWVLWVEFCPIEKYVEILYQWMWPYLEMSLCRCKQVRMKSLERAFIQYGWCPFRNKRQGEYGLWWWRERWKRWTYKAKNADSCQQTQEGKSSKEGFSPTISERACLCHHLNFGLLGSRTEIIKLY